jgi:hypothetical protein
MNPENIRSAFLFPIENIKSPPTNGITIFGNE